MKRRVLPLFGGRSAEQDVSRVTAVASCAGPAGPCTKSASGKVLASGARLAGPGGVEVFRDRDGALWAAFHAFSAARASPAWNARSPSSYRRCSSADGARADGAANASAMQIRIACTAGL